MRVLSPVDAAWLLVESRDTPMHVGGLMEFTLPDGAAPDYLRKQIARVKEERNLVSPWNLKPIEGPVVGARLPLMKTVRDVDLDYHVRHSALPSPGGQRELGELVSRLHGLQLDLRRPLWELHVIEGLEGNRFAIYTKLHHSLIDGVSGMRMLMAGLSKRAEDLETPAFWTVGPSGRRKRAPSQSAIEPHRAVNPAGVALQVARSSAIGLGGLGRAALEMTQSSLSGGALQAPFRNPGSPLAEQIGGARRFATQQYELEHLKELANAAHCSLNDIVLYLCGAALRRYLLEHSRLPSRSLTAGIPVSLRGANDNRTGTAIGFFVAELGTDVSDPLQRLEVIKRSTVAAKDHLGRMPRETLAVQSVVINGPWIAGLVAGLGHRAPVPFSLAVSNVPGPKEPLYFAGSRLDAIFPLSLIMHGNALNITCLSYAGTLGFGLTGARDTLPHLQRLAIYLREALVELDDTLAAVGAA